VKTIDLSKRLDPEAERMGAVLHYWEEVIGEGRWITVKDAIDEATSCPAGDLTGHDEDEALANQKHEQRAGLLDAFRAVAAPIGRVNELIDHHRLGKWLAKHKDRVMAGRRIVLVPEKIHGYAQWCLERVG
jgi:hypothetical protein